MPLQKKTFLSLLLMLLLFISGALLIRDVRERVNGAIIHQSALVVIRGEVTYLDRDSDLLFLQNRSAAYRVDAPKMPRGFKRGDILEILASVNSDAGSLDYRAVKIKMLGPGGQVKPITIDSKRSLSDQKLAQRFIQTSGIVRGASFELSGQLALRLKVGKEEIELRILEPLDLQSNFLVDSTLQFRGVLENEFAPNGEPIRAVVMVPQASDVQIKQSPRPLNEFEVKSIRDLETTPVGELAHRVRAQGRIVRTLLGELRLVDETGGLELNSIAEQARADRQYDAWGFVTHVNGTFVLEDAVWAERDGAGAHESGTKKDWPSSLKLHRYALCPVRWRASATQ